MSSLSGKQVGEIKNLYESIYTEETVDEVSEEISDEELFSLFLEDFVDSILETLEEENLLKEGIHLKESVDLDENKIANFLSNKFGQRFFGRQGPLGRLFNQGNKVTERIPKSVLKDAERRYGGPIDPNRSRLLNTQDATVTKNKATGKLTVDEKGVKGDFGRDLRNAIIAGGTATFGGTDIGRSLMNRVSNALGGAVQGAGQGFMKDPQSKGNNNNNQPGIYQAPDGTIRVR